MPPLYTIAARRVRLSRLVLAATDTHTGVLCPLPVLFLLFVPVVAVVAILAAVLLATTALVFFLLLALILLLGPVLVLAAGVGFDIVGHVRQVGVLVGLDNN